MAVWRLVVLLKCFTSKKVSLTYEDWTKKDREKIESNQKNIYIDKNKEKEGILCEVGAFYTVLLLMW